MSRVFDDGVKFIMEHDVNEQRNFLKVIAETRYADVDYLLKLGCFFVPNADYLLDCFGKECLEWECDFYNNEGECKWVGYMMIPIRNVFGSIVGFVGYNPLSKLKLDEAYANGTTGDSEIPPKYIDSSKNCFDRNKFLFIPNGYDKFLSDEPLLIVDGTFDAITLGSLGYNVCANLGTNISQECLFLMSFAKKRYIIADNDLAGLKLLNSIKSKLPSSTSISQKKCKDIDEYITKYGVTNFRNKVDRLMDSKMLVPIIL